MDLKRSIIFKDVDENRRCVDSASITCLTEVTTEGEANQTHITVADSLEIKVNMTMEQVLGFIAETQGLTKKPEKKSDIIKPEPNIITN